MKRIFSTAALAAVVLFAACSKDNSGAIGSGENGVGSKMGLSFTMTSDISGKDQTRGTTLTPGEPVDGTVNECVVNSVTVFVFNSDGTYDTHSTQGGYADFTDIANEFDVDDKTYTLKEAKAINVMVGVKRIYVGINLPADFKSKANVPNEAALMAARDFIIDVTAARGDDNLTGTDGVAMFSEKVAENTLVAMEAGSTETPDANVIKIDMVRMVAKVVAQTSNAGAAYDVTYNAGEALSLQTSVNYSVKNFILMQQATSIYTAQKIVGSKLVTPGGVLPYSYYETIYTPVPPATAGFEYTKVGNSSENITALEFAYTGENAPKSSFVKEATYMLVQTKMLPLKKAIVNGAAIETTGHTFAAADDIWVVRSKVVGDEQQVYFCASSDDANAVANKMNELDANAGATIKQYYGGYAYFMVFLNKDNANKTVDVYRNQFIHVLINGINGSKFTATRGTDGSDGEDPEDPTDPTDPYTPDPEDPIFELESQMLVEVTLKPWDYLKNTVILGN